MPSLADHLRAYFSRPPAQADEPVLTFLRKRDPWLLAHHPASAAAKEHVWEIKGFFICKGCLMAWCGAAMGLVVHPLLLLVFGNWWNRFGYFEIAAVFASLLLPTVVTSFWKRLPWIKHSARFGLGLLVISTLVYLLALPWNTWQAWGVRILVLGIYWGVRIPLEHKRQNENLQLGKKP